LFVAYVDLSALEDTELVAEAARENHDALAVLFDRYQRLVFHVARRIVQDDGEAEDLTQEIFFEIYSKASLYDAQRGSVKVWLLQYAYHRSFTRKAALARRRHAREPLSPEALRVANAPDEKHGGLTRDEWGTALRQALESAHEKQRITIELAFFEQLTLREIAETTRQSFGNVRHYYYRGLKHLKDVFFGRSVSNRRDSPDLG
jgi:RNA polymerase sigma-70 factor (ECF subfamily)